MEPINRFARINPEIREEHTLNSVHSEFQTPLFKIGILWDKKPFGGKWEILNEGVHIWIYADTSPCFR